MATAVATAAIACGSDRRFTPAPARTTLGVQTVEIPVSRCGTRFIMLATVDGAGPFRFLLDTGSSVTLLGSNVASAASLRSLPGGGVIDTTSGSRKLDRAVRVGSLRSGELEVGEFDALVYERSEVTDGRPFDGILGMSAFASVTLRLDYPAGRVSATRTPLREDDHTFTVDFSTGVPVVWASWGTFTVPAVLDSGYTGELALPRGGDWTFDTQPESRARYGRLHGDVSFANLVLAHPAVGWTDAPALIGGGALRDVVVTLDARNHLVRFDGPMTIARRSHRGIGVAFREGADSWEVVSAFDDTPATRAGLHVGDRVLAIDAAPVSTFGCGAWDDRLRKPDTVRLVVARGDQRLEFEIVPETLLE